MIISSSFIQKQENDNATILFKFNDPSPDQVPDASTVVNHAAGQLRNRSITPLYINTDRMLDECAMLSGGYSSFQEVSISNSTSSGNSAKMGFGAKFRAWVVNFSLKGEVEMSRNGTDQTVSHEKRTQTTASLLRKLISDICSPASTVNADVDFIKNHVIGELCLFSKVQIVGAKKISPWEKKSSSIAIIGYETVKLSLYKRYDKLNGLKDRIFVNIKTPLLAKEAGYTFLSPEFFYQSQFNDIVDTELNCLCKITGGKYPNYRYEIVALFI